VKVHMRRCRICGFPKILPAQPGQRRAQRSAGNLEQPLERPVEFEDQKDRTGNER
jgi:hypothetical protein